MLNNNNNIVKYLQIVNISIKPLKRIQPIYLSMFYCYDDNKFKKIIDEFILSSTNNKQLSSAIRNIDQQAAKLGIFFIK